MGGKGWCLRVPTWLEGRERGAAGVLEVEGAHVLRLSHLS